MKKALIVLLALLLPGTAILWTTSSRSLSFTTGYYLVADNGTHLLIDGNTPICLSDRAQSGLLEKFVTGDKFLVIHDAVAESYPAQTQVYAAFKIGEGSIEDIPVSVLDNLLDMGWKFDGIERIDPLFSLTPFPTSVSWANYGDDSILWQRALNLETAAISSVQHLPILRFDSVDELTAFKAAITGKLETQNSYDEIPSFDTVTAHMNDTFFNEHTLLLTYVWAGSCTWRYDVNHVDMGQDHLTIHVQRTDSFEVGDCAMAGWFITLSVPKDALQSISIFDADLGNLME